MEKHCANSEEKFLKSVVLHYASGNYVFVDEALTQKVTADEIRAAYPKCQLIIHQHHETNEIYRNVVGITDHGTYVELFACGPSGISGAMYTEEYTS